jgi:hypothetical protein
MEIVETNSLSSRDNYIHRRNEETAGLTSVVLCEIRESKVKCSMFELQTLSASINSLVCELLILISICKLTLKYTIYGY